MADYAYYKKYYGKSDISEEDFPGAMARAKAVLNKIKATYILKEDCLIAEELALYKMAKTILWDDKRQEDIRQTKLGNITVIYADMEPLDKKLLKIAFSYMRFYRGVES